MIEHDVRACLITNPRSGRGGVDLSDALTVLQAHGWEVVVRQKVHGGQATELAREAVRDGCNVVVDCGGDGTLSEIVDGVVGTDAAVGTLPGGTANLWAHEVGISRQLRIAAMQLVGAERQRVDVGRVAINGKHEQHFLLMAGLGADGAVISRVSKPLKNRIGPLAVALAAAEAVPTWRAVPVRAEMDDVHWHGRVSQVIIGNTRRYAGFTQVTPGAFMDDGLLDICLISASGPLSTGRQLASLVLRQRPSPASAETFRAASLTLRSPMILPLQVDGGSVKVDDDAVTEDGVTYTFAVVTRGVTVLVPRLYDGTLFQRGPQTARLANMPLQPVKPAARHRDSGNGNGNGARQRTGAEKKWTMVVLHVGVDSFTAARRKDGRVIRVLVSEETTLKDRAKQKQRLWGALSSIVEGDVVKVRGHKNGEANVLQAERVALLGDAAAKRMS